MTGAGCVWTEALAGRRLVTCGAGNSLAWRGLNGWEESRWQAMEVAPGLAATVLVHSPLASSLRGSGPCSPPSHPTCWHPYLGLDHPPHLHPPFSEPHPVRCVPGCCQAIGGKLSTCYLLLMLLGTGGCVPITGSQPQLKSKDQTGLAVPGSPPSPAPGSLGPA